MALGVIDQATVTVVADLADDYALRVLDDLPQVTDEKARRDGLAGAFLSFLAEAVLTAHNMSA